MSRPTYLLVHGWGADHRAWEDVQRLLVRRARVFAPDLPGHGGCTSVRGAVTGGLTVADFSRALTETLEMAGGPPVVAVGHSMGAQAVVALAVARPDLVGAVAVVDPAYGADEAEMMRAPEVLADLRVRGTAAGVEFVDRAFPAREPEGLWRSVREQMSCTGGEVLADLYESMYLGELSMGPRRGTRSWLEQVRKPVLSLYSTRPAADFAGTLPWPAGSRIEVWPGMTHYLHQQQPSRFVRLLETWALPSGGVCG
jgi:pimeloyl-ACP methyl ester carboxylesterase